MVENLKQYLSHVKKCMIYYFSPIILIYIICFSNAKSTINTNIDIDKVKLLNEILLKNSLCFLWILSGIIFGKMIINSFLIINGIVMGLILSKLASASQFLIILPHGILEIGAFIFSCCITCEIIRKKSFKKYEKTYLLIAYFFVIFAAFIEAFFTTSLIQYL